MTSGLQPGDLSIIAARPSMGKTTLALNIAHNVAKIGLPALIFSLEMPARQIAARMIAAEGEINFGFLRTGNLNEELWDRVTQATTDLVTLPIYFNDSRGLSVQALTSEARRIKSECDNLSLIVIDYLQLLTSGEKSYGRVEEITNISRQLKTLAWELDVPVLDCSQLSREVEKRQDKRPQLSDLRESGAIEQDADVVAFLYREAYYDEDAQGEVELADIIFRKQRNGPTGTVQLNFHKKLMLFADLPI